MNKHNERSWAGQLIAWILQAIAQGNTIFQHASNDEGVKMESGRTKFPDILLFTNKSAGVIFNGWELKFPNTKVDDIEMLENALEKAQRFKANSFVTWNGSEAIIWGIQNEIYEINHLSKLKIYPKEKGIDTREDLANPAKYQIHEPKLKQRLLDILHDLAFLYEKGIIKPALNVSNEIIEAINQVGLKIIPSFAQQIIYAKDNDPNFRKDFNIWRIRESATLKILASSSRRQEQIEEETVLAKFGYYKLIGKIIFYLTLSHNLQGKIPKLVIREAKNLKSQLDYFFNKAQQIDYQAIFRVDFSENIEFDETIELFLMELIHVFDKFDFKILPTSVIGNILENLVPDSEKQKFGQYFTPENLALLVAFSAVKNKNTTIFDPTSGTGTFLTAAYQILSFLGNKQHQTLLDQIWGNDISHFPAVLSVINLYKQNLGDIANFPRITRDDFFNLQPNKEITFPDNKNIDKINKLPLPYFDAIVSNFPFIRQEDIPNDAIKATFKKQFEQLQTDFLQDKDFKINEQSDYYTYCTYHALKFLKNEAFLASITSNAWLGKNYGLQFKRFLLKYFSIKYIIKSDAEHWFKTSQVSTIFMTLQKQPSTEPTRFVTINFKLEDKLNGNLEEKLNFIENFYTEIEHCQDFTNIDWIQDKQYPSVYHKSDNSIRVSIVSNERLWNSLESQESWSVYFIAENPLLTFESKMINPSNNLFTNGRGVRTGQDDMFLLNKGEVEKWGIEKYFLQPILQSSKDIKNIFHLQEVEKYLFVCNESEDILKKSYPNAYKWIKKWELKSNKLGEPLPLKLNHNRPFWYSVQTGSPANIFISINPGKKLFFAYSPTPIFLNQRLVAIRANNEDTPIIVALLNSVTSLLVIELNGVSRSLGTLDLNANFFKHKIKILNPDLLDKLAKQKILKKFEPLSKREILDYDKEFKQKDRKAFDETVLEAFGYVTKILPHLYNLLTETIHNRVNMKDK